MNTLTKFIADNLSTLDTNSTLSTGYSDKKSDSAQYEVIENESLNNSHINGLSISGSLFSLTTFKQVTFESCVFYASKMENCEFIDCKFINCRFEFSEILHCNFRTTNFIGCSWELSPIKKTTFEHCGLDWKATHFFSKEDNHITGCYSLNDTQWDQPKSEGPWGVFLGHFKKTLAA